MKKEYEKTRFEIVLLNGKNILTESGDPDVKLDENELPFVKFTGEW